jgi:hypothetical protein
MHFGYAEVLRLNPPNDSPHLADVRSRSNMGDYWILTNQQSRAKVITEI